MNAAVNVSNQIHTQALTLSAQYKKTEAAMIDILMQVENHKIHLTKGHASLFLYVVHELGLSESVAYNFITVMRKTREVPALRNMIAEGEISLSNARKIAPVITEANQDVWLSKAAKLSNRILEKEIAKVRPEALTPERTKYVTDTRLKVELGLPEAAMTKLRRAQDLVSQNESCAATLEDTIIAMTNLFLKYKDPVEKSKRVINKKGFANYQSYSTVSIKHQKSSTTSPAKTTADDKSSDLLKTSDTHMTASHPTTIQKPSPSPVTLQVDSSVTAASIISASATYASITDTSTSTNPKRQPIPAALLHQIRHRDQGKCAYKNQYNQNCHQTRWLEIHHKVPVSQGGKNTLDNLVTLCSNHHDWIHRKNINLKN